MAFEEATIFIKFFNSGSAAARLASIWITGSAPCFGVDWLVGAAAAAGAGTGPGVLGVDLADGGRCTGGLPALGCDGRAACRFGAGGP